MKIYTAIASSDWGYIYQSEIIKATNWPTAYRRAALKAAKEVRKRPRQMTITVRLVGSEQKQKPDANQASE